MGILREREIRRIHAENVEGIQIRLSLEMFLGQKKRKKAIELSEDSSKRALGYLKSTGLNRQGADHPAYSPRDQFVGCG